jgi:hypothetical protein
MRAAVVRCTAAWLQLSVFILLFSKQYLIDLTLLLL